ncbi:MAG TPA: cytochrome c biogenesis protein ResB [Ignavibacteriales bacterium]|nr:cytochrome c biogenesis protein ResB [Ignavibacteriales bacterium]HRT98808.1 cytochrome c biogenesis protein ResB [Ignavibacteriales bacterium]
MIISGFVPQVKDNTLLTTIGLTHIVSSIPFTFLTLLLVINLLFALWKRIFLPLSIKNVTFIINHLGILIVLLFGSIAAFDLIRTTMYIEKNKVIWYSFNDNNKDVVQLPFAIELKDFDIDYFEPNIQLLKIKDISNNKLDLISQVSVDKNKILKLKDFEIKIHRIIDYAWFIEDTVYTNYSPGYTKAVYVTIKRKNQMINSWLSFPTFVQNARYVRIGDYVLMLSTPQPKKYISYVKVYEKSGRVYDDSILVNHPLDIEGWKVYQKDYDQNLGEFSNISILEVNHDRWLSIVYFGLYMMIIGSILLLITSRRKNVSNI